MSASRWELVAEAAQAVLWLAIAIYLPRAIGRLHGRIDTMSRRIGELSRGAPPAAGWTPPVTNAPDPFRKPTRQWATTELDAARSEMERQVEESNAHKQEPPCP